MSTENPQPLGRSLYRCVEAMSNEPLPNSEFILYQTKDGCSRIQCGLANCAKGELAAQATIKSHLIVGLEGALA